MSKKVIRLTESELKRMISNIVAEQVTSTPKPQVAQKSVKDDPDYNKAWGVMNSLIEAIEGVGTNEPNVLKAVQSIGTQRVYNYLLQIVQKSPTVKSKTGSNYKTVMQYINTDFSIPSFDKPEHQQMARPNDQDAMFAGYNNDGYSKKTSTQIPKQCQAILQKFNKEEFMDVQTTYDY